MRITHGCVERSPRPSGPGRTLTWVTEQLPPDHEDSPALSPPQKPSGWREMSDDDLAKFVRKLGYANQWAFHLRAEHEMTVRLILALQGFKAAADRSARILNILTGVLVVLTLVLVVYAIRAW